MPAQDFERLKIHLSDQPALMAQAMLDVYSKSLNRKFLESLSKLKTETPNQAVVLAKRILFFENIKIISAQIEKHQINIKNSKTLSTSLKERSKMLENLDRLANQAIAEADWSSQVISLNLVAKQNKRFYDEVLSLPVPEGLVGDQVQEYLTLLTQQVAPQQNKAQMSEIKLTEFWADQKISLKYNEAYQNMISSHPTWIKYLRNELAELELVAPVESKENFKNIVAKIDQSENSITSKSQPSIAELEKARLELKANPFEIAALKNILELEKLGQRTAMVKYLENRLSGLTKNNENIQSDKNATTQETH